MRHRYLYRKQSCPPKPDLRGMRTAAWMRIRAVRKACPLVAKLTTCCISRTVRWLTQSTALTITSLILQIMHHPQYSFGVNYHMEVNMISHIYPLIYEREGGYATTSLWILTSCMPWPSADHVNSAFSVGILWLLLPARVTFDWVTITTPLTMTKARVWRIDRWPFQPDTPDPNPASSPTGGTCLFGHSNIPYTPHYRTGADQWAPRGPCQST